jgi:hypothetical protein
MLESIGSALVFVVAIGLVATPFWVLHALWRWRCEGAARRAAAELEGRYEKGGHLSGGTIYGRADGRDVVVTFFTGSRSKRAETTAIAILAKPRSGQLLVRRRLLGGWDGAEGLPPGSAEPLMRLESFRGARVEAFASNLLSVRVAGVLHDASRILELVAIGGAVARELDRS